MATPARRPGEPTGRYLVLLPVDAIADAVAALRRVASLAVVPRSQAGTAQGAAGVVYERLGVAVVQADPDQLEAVRRAVAAEEEPLVAVEAERVLVAFEAPGGSFEDTAEHTWGIQATAADATSWTGAGVRVAILDTGIDLGHPDFAGREVVSESFVAGQPIDDVQGHGTHCAGIACGPREPAEGPRYGVAGEALLHAGKVLGDDGSGTDEDILAGIEWAVERECAIVSMSLGAPVQPGDQPSEVFEQAARRAQDAGTALFAAAGNESQRSDGVVAPVGHPANCASIVAVGALDSRLAVADFSNGASGSPGGELDVAAPGVDVRSSWPRPENYRSLSGTSMATPFVAGLAALYAQAEEGLAGAALAARTVEGARELPLPASDVGAGLAQAPS